MLYEIILEPEQNVLEKKLKKLGLYFQRLFIWDTISENFFFKEFFWRLPMMVHIPSLGLSGPIGSAVLTFIDYKETDGKAKYIYRCIYSFVPYWAAIWVFECSIEERTEGTRIPLILM